MHFTQLFYPKASVVMPPAATHKKPRSRRRCGASLGCCCCSIFATLCSLLFTVTLLLGLATLITWLILRPIHSPKFSVESLQVKTFNVTPQGSLNADILYTVVANNLNGKIGWKYDVITMETSYGGRVFGLTSIPAFSQGHRNVTTVTSGFVIENYKFVPASVGSTLATNVERGSVALHARASAKVRLKVGAITSFPVRVHVNCDFTVKPPTATAPGSVITKTCNLTR